MTQDKGSGSGQVGGARWAGLRQYLLGEYFRVWEVRIVNQDNLVVYGNRESSAKVPDIHGKGLHYGGSPEVTLLYKGRG